MIGATLLRHWERMGIQAVAYDWDELRSIRPEPGDVLIGHPHPMRGTVWRRSARRPGWARVIAMSPYNGDLRQVGFLDEILGNADEYLAITGAYWYELLHDSYMGHWAARTQHLDLAVDRDVHPRIKTKFSPPGSRRILYLGHTGWQKDPEYLERIAELRPDWSWSWMGNGRPLAGWHAYGRRDIGDPATRELIAEHDFVITVGSFDANPMTILETMAWGLLPVCTPTSGYAGEPGITNVPVGDELGAIEVLESLQQMSEDELRKLVARNDERLADHYNWERFCRDVDSALHRRESTAASVPSADARSAIRRATRNSPYALHRPDGFKMRAAALVHRVRR